MGVAWETLVWEHREQWFADGNEKTGGRGGTAEAETGTEVGRDTGTEAEKSAEAKHGTVGGTTLGLRCGEESDLPLPNRYAGWSAAKDAE